MSNYDVSTIEKKWQERWASTHVYATPATVDSTKKLYILPQLPYPSGSGLHVGHAEVYTSCDIYARAKRMQGKQVLQAIGWDAFGLPAENYAIKSNVHPRITTNAAIDNFRYQIKRMGISVDWDREVGSHQPEYYKWTQWFFLLMYERGLAYRKNQQVNWCESCKTVLANEQVVNGCCERCSTDVQQRKMEQWYLKITDYAERLYNDLDMVDWPKETVVNQRNWIGKKVGVEISYDIENSDFDIVCFTTRPETNFGATFIVVGPEHMLVRDILRGLFPSITTNTLEKISTYVQSMQNKTQRERLIGAKEKTGVFTELYAINKLNGMRLPIYIADYVLGDVGTGAVVGVPGHDTRDFEFAKAFDLPIIRVVVGNDNKTSPIVSSEDVLESYGNVVNSDFLNRYPSLEAQKVITTYLEEKGWGKRVTNYRLRDWSVSRQRFWGAPIPMIYDNNGNLHPIAEQDLPVILPDDVDFMPTGQSPLTYSQEFQQGVEEKYGKGWHREVDTLDTFMCSSWYYFRYIDPHNTTAFASKDALKTWMPVDFYIGGPEHTNGHLLYSRFFTKVLYDAGYIDFSEPFMLHRHQGLILGEDNRKMSKRWGNVINPTDVMDRHGADVLRMYEMFIGPLSATKAWSTKGENGVWRFLQRVWNLQDKVSNTTSEDQRREVNKLIDKVTRDIDALSFNTSIAAFMEFVNFLYKEKTVSVEVWKVFLLLLAPFAVHMSEELWERQGWDYSIHKQSWPVADKKYLVNEMADIPVQINGKVKYICHVPLEVSVDSQLLESFVRDDSHVIDLLSEKQIKRVIVVPGAIVNFLT